MLVSLIIVLLTAGGYFFVNVEQLTNQQYPAEIDEFNIRTKSLVTELENIVSRFDSSLSSYKNINQLIIEIYRSSLTYSSGYNPEILREILWGRNLREAALLCGPVSFDTREVSIEQLFSKPIISGEPPLPKLSFGSTSLALSDIALAEIPFSTDQLSRIEDMNNELMVNGDGFRIRRCSIQTQYRYPLLGLKHHFDRSLVIKSKITDFLESTALDEASLDLKSTDLSILSVTQRSGESIAGYLSRLAQITPLFDEINKQTLQTAAALKNLPERIELIESSSADISATVTRLGSALILIFLVQILVTMYRYNIRLSSFYDARADAIEIAAATNNMLRMDEIISFLAPDSLDFGKAPASPAQHAIDLAKEIIQKSNRTD